MHAHGHPLEVEQSALRRVAAFAARGSPLEQVFEVVTAEASALLDGEPTALMRHDRAGGQSVVVAQTGGLVAVGERFAVSDESLSGRIVRSRRQERVDDLSGSAEDAPTRELGLRGVVAAPVTVYGEFWG